jgi:hypothetical protein
MVENNIIIDETLFTKDLDELVPLFNTKKYSIVRYIKKILKKINILLLKKLIILKKMEVVVTIKKSIF